MCARVVAVKDDYTVRTSSAKFFKLCGPTLNHTPIRVHSTLAFKRYRSVMFSFDVIGKVSESSGDQLLNYDTTLFISYPVHIYEVGYALVILLRLRVSMDDDGFDIQIETETGPKIDPGSKPKEICIRTRTEFGIASDIGS
ncbi:hypothetical protein EVAR_101999_1 [Eumeta japonica]|uniref:Uncharacterized protein n=1 Tax=Eumeta variegata TaxID=151549 RepID=A0A4C1TT39_EUMVA|nr:hypothetical protein EVAR_101999_1 [Eumeta japonica]